MSIKQIKQVILTEPVGDMKACPYEILYNGVCPHRDDTDHTRIYVHYAKVYRSGKIKVDTSGRPMCRCNINTPGPHQKEKRTPDHRRTFAHYH